MVFTLKYVFELLTYNNGVSVQKPIYDWNIYDRRHPLFYPLSATWASGVCSILVLVVRLRLAYHHIMAYAYKWMSRNNTRTTRMLGHNHLCEWWIKAILVSIEWLPRNLSKIHRARDGAWTREFFWKCYCNIKPLFRLQQIIQFCSVDYCLPMGEFSIPIIVIVLIFY